VAYAAAEAILAEQDGDGRIVPPDRAQCELVVDSFSHTMGGVSGTMRLGMNGLLGLIELLPVVVVGRPRRMSKLALGDRIAFLQALEDSRSGLLPMLLMGVKVPMSLYAYEQGEPLRKTGFDRASTVATANREPRVP